MASRLFFAAVLGLLQLSFGTPSPWTARLLSTEEVNGTNETESAPTTTTTTTTTTVLFYHKVKGRMTLDVEDPEAFVNNPESKVAIAKSLAATLKDVAEDMINVTLELKDTDARRLAAGRALQADKSVVVTYIITLSGSDASAAATLGDDLVQSILSISTEDMKASLTQAFEDAGLTVVLGEIVIDQDISSQAIDSSGGDESSSSGGDESSSSGGDESSSSGGDESSSSGGDQSSSSGGDQSSSSGGDEDDGSVMQSQAYVFMLLGLLTTLVHA